MSSILFYRRFFLYALAMSVWRDFFFFMTLFLSLFLYSFVFCGITKELCVDLILFSLVDIYVREIRAMSAEKSAMILSE